MAIAAFIIWGSLIFLIGADEPAEVTFYEVKITKEDE